MSEDLFKPQDMIDPDEISVRAAEAHSADWMFAQQDVTVRECMSDILNRLDGDFAYTNDVVVEAFDRLASLVRDRTT